MTEQQAAYGIPRPVPPQAGTKVEPGRPDGLPAGLCMRCGAVGTHYLTCPGLRLPPGYHLSDDPGPEGR